MEQIFAGMGYYAAPDRPLTPYWIKPGEERLELLIAGKVVFEENGRESLYGPGIIFWHREGECTVCRPVQKDPYRCFVVSFLTEDTPRCVPRVNRWNDREEFNSFCREMFYQAHADGLDRKLFGRMLYWRLVWGVSCGRQPETSSLPPALKTIQMRLMEEPEREWDIARLANEAGMSESSLYALFRKYFEISPHQYLLQQRVHRARMNLAECDLPIKEVAVRCGFSSLENFYRAFRKACGMTPAAYRRQITPER